ncbi:7,8-dihydro-6-hydroxymethylpterin-pyrophosphokinase (HPPK) [Candidatus Gugararchaeum adminiculabundum]|nr:7,8-dihydro-6-hydroxymethylpterin-pyrophosphokinase (HPPK) [Candidatus Gugararchaeum adminiculabundum]
MATAYFSLGSNLGDREGNLKKALAELWKINGVSVKKISSFYETEPVDVEGGEFVNCCVEAEVNEGMEARGLLRECLKIEKRMGRDRKKKNEARIIDIDLLLFGNERIDEKELKIPHPEMKKRLFVLIPLQEIAPGILIDGEKIDALIAKAEKKEVRKMR